jgi:hypothetical protein
LIRFAKPMAVRHQKAIGAALKRRALSRGTVLSAVPVGHSLDNGTNGTVETLGTVGTRGTITTAHRTATRASLLSRCLARVRAAGFHHAQHRCSPGAYPRSTPCPVDAFRASRLAIARQGIPNPLSAGMSGGRVALSMGLGLTSIRAGFADGVRACAEPRPIGSFLTCGRRVAHGSGFLDARQPREARRRLLPRRDHSPSPTSERPSWAISVPRRRGCVRLARIGQTLPSRVDQPSSRSMN